MKDLVIIIPMHEFGKENVELLNKAVESVPEGLKIVLSVKKGVDGRTLKGISDRLTVLAESDGDSFAELVNTAVNNIDENVYGLTIMIRFTSRLQALYALGLLIRYQQY